MRRPIETAPFIGTTTRKLTLFLLAKPQSKEVFLALRVRASLLSYVRQTPLKICENLNGFILRQILTDLDCFPPDLALQPSGRPSEPSERSSSLQSSTLYSFFSLPTTDFLAHCYSLRVKLNGLRDRKLVIMAREALTNPHMKST